MVDPPLSSVPAGEPAAPEVTRADTSMSAWFVARVDTLLRLGLLGIILIAAVIFTIRTIPSGSLADIGQSTFLSVGNLQDLARQMAVVGVISIGETFVIITAGIDLSVGAVIGIAGILTALEFLDSWPTPFVIITVLLFSLAVGLTNGFLVSVGKIPPFIVTLGMMGILRGMAYLVGNGLSQALSPSGETIPFTTWVEGTFLGIPTIFLVFVAIGVVAGAFLRFTRHGRYIYAQGSNPEGARRAGINVRATILTVYAISGVLAGVAALLLTGRLGSANPNNGLGNELDAIAAAVLGGASLFGARGTVVGTFLGVVLVNMLANGIDLINIDPHVQQVVEGMLLIAIVWIDQWRKRRIVAA
ncbi:MAG TPA: ABC transporter permease [Chloroflexota bacterium]|nr:ABC transporter permease [Chloroflexota bacterium]